MAYLPDLALALAAFLVGILSPGPNLMAILSTALSEGRGPGRAVATGIAAGSTRRRDGSTRPWACCSVLPPRSS